MSLRPLHGWLLGVLVGALPVQAAPFPLTVTDGSRSGSYEQGSKIDVWANPAGSGLTFDRWTGNTTGVADIFSAHTTITMPGANTTLQATYKAVDPWLSPRVATSFPNTPRQGTIFVFHGAGGCAVCLFTDTQFEIFVREAAGRGYAIVALDSQSRISRDWDTTTASATNPDMQNVVALRNYLIGRGQVSSAEPLLLMGISQGGQFASLVSQAAPSLGLTIKAQVLSIASGDLAAVTSAGIPTIFTLAQNDGLTDGSSPNARAQSGYSTLVNQGTPTQILTNPPAPVYPNRFWNISGLTPTDSQTIYTSLKNGGYLSSTDYLLQDPYSSTWSTVIPSQYISFIPEIEDELLVSFAEHKFFSDFNNKVFDFLTTPTTVLTQVPGVEGFSPTNAPVGASVVITGSNFAGITSVTFGGVASVFSVESPTRITTTVPAGAVTGPIRVSNTAGTAVSTSTFVVAVAPSVSSFTPSTAPVGATVTINGSNFVNVSAVSFGGVGAVYTVLSPTQINAVVPNGAVSGALRVTTPGGLAVSPTNFVVAVGPSITSFSPSSAPVGTMVTIDGTDLGNATSVTFGGVSASFTVSSATRLRATVPNGAVTGPIRVTNPAGTATSATNFVVAVAPTITTLTPSRGPIGSSVVIDGTNFEGVSGITFNGTSATAYTVNSPTRITVTVPVGATTGKVKVTTPGGVATSPGRFTLQ